MNKKPLISLSVILITLALLSYYVYKHLTDFSTLLTIASQNIFLIILLALFSVLFFYTNGLLLDSLMRPFGLRLKVKESFGLAIVTNFYNTITPFRGGMAARAVYLKKKHDFAYVNFLATLSAIYILIFLVASTLGIISMTYIYLEYGLFNWLIALLFLAVILFMSGIIIFSPKFKERENKWLNRFVKVINGWHLIKNNKKVIFITILITLVQLSLGSISTMITYSIFGIEMDFFKAMLIACIGNLSILVAITPGNLGIGDAISVFSASIVGIGLSGAVAATILGRAVGLIVILILGPIFSYILIKRDKSEEGKNEKVN